MRANKFDTKFGTGLWREVNKHTRKAWLDISSRAERYRLQAHGYQRALSAPGLILAARLWRPLWCYDGLASGAAAPSTLTTLTGALATPTATSLFTRSISAAAAPALCA